MSYHKMNCIVCNKKLKRQQKKHCSNLCRRTRINKRYDIGQNGKISTASIGAGAELAVGSDLINKGYYVFRNLSPNGPCDLIIMKDGVLKKIEVKTGRIHTNGQLTFGYSKLRDGGNFDILAVWTDHNIFYFHPPE